MDQTSRRLDVDGSYMVLPGLMMLTFGDSETHTSETKLIKCPRGLDVAKLERVNRISHMVARGKMAVPEALEELEAVRTAPPTWSTLWVLGAYVVSAATVAALFFGGSWTDVWVSGIFGLFGKVSLFEMFKANVICHDVVINTLAFFFFCHSGLFYSSCRAISNDFKRF